MIEKSLFLIYIQSGFKNLRKNGVIIKRNEPGRIKLQYRILGGGWGVPVILNNKIQL